MKRAYYHDIWPIDERAGRKPGYWTGWPDRKKFALVLTHDVDTAKGQSKCKKLMQIEMELGFRSAFNFVPERYRVHPELRYFLKNNGFEVGVHGLCHDGRVGWSGWRRRHDRLPHLPKRLRESEAGRGPALSFVRWSRPHFSDG